MPIYIPNISKDKTKQMLELIAQRGRGKSTFILADDIFGYERGTMSKVFQEREAKAKNLTELMVAGRRKFKYK